MASQPLITFEMLEQIAVLVWTKSGNTQMAEHLAAVKLLGQLWERFSGQSDADVLRAETILKISQYVKDHPRASKDQLTAEIGRQIEDFAKKIENM